MRAVAVISLSTGAVVDLDYAVFSGKGTGETTLLRGMIGAMKEGDVIVADRLYPSYATLAMMKNRGVDMIAVSHQNRIVNYKLGQVLGPRDHIVEWERPQQAKRGISREVYRTLPRRLKVREFSIEIEGRDGKPETLTIVTTITGETIPQKELADLYFQRWNCELDLRSIKHSLHMDVLRCKTPEVVKKELWCHLLAYNLLRGTMVESAKRTAVMPRQLSVKGTMQAVESFTQR